MQNFAKPETNKSLFTKKESEMQPKFRDCERSQGAFEAIARTQKLSESRKNFSVYRYEYIFY